MKTFVIVTWVLAHGSLSYGPATHTVRAFNLDGCKAIALKAKSDTDAKVSLAPGHKFYWRCIQMETKGDDQ